MKIRAMQEKDYGRIAELLEGIAALHHAGRPDIFGATGGKYDEGELRKLSADEKTRVLVAADESDEAVGYAICKLREYPLIGVRKAYRSFYVDDLCVDPASRRQGVARALMEAVKETARAEGCFNVELNVWEFNESARKFYESIGMTTQRRNMEYKL